MTDQYRLRGETFDTLRQMLDYLAEDWLSAGWTLEVEDEVDSLAKFSDQHLALECVNEFGLGLWHCEKGHLEEHGPSHMWKYGYGDADVAAAFGRLRETLSRLEVRRFRKSLEPAVVKSGTLGECRRTIAVLLGTDDLEKHRWGSGEFPQIEAYAVTDDESSPRWTICWPCDRKWGA